MKNIKFKRWHYLIIISALLLGGYAIIPSLHNNKADCVTRLEQILPSCHGQIEQAFFTPQDQIASTLIDLIDSEQKSIKVAIYFLTNPGIGEALKKAKLGRNVEIEVVTDPGHVKESPNSQVWPVSQAGIPVFVYKFAPVSGNANPIMHNKFMVFAKNFNDQSIVTTGSFNYTISAQKYNRENIVILNNPDLVEKFAKQWEYLKEHATPLDEFARENGLNQKHPLHSNF